MSPRKFCHHVTSFCHHIHHGFYIEGVQIFQSNSQRIASINPEMLDDFDDDGASMDPTSSVCEESNSKAVFDTALKLDSSHTEEVDAVEACRRHGGQKYITCSVVLLCCLACQGINEMMKKEDRYSMAVTSFLEALESWPQKAEANRVMKGMNEPCSDGPPSWPDDVRSAALSFLDKNNAGVRVWSAYANAQRMINNNINPLWKERLASGENETQLLEAIRKRIWETVTAKGSTQIVHYISINLLINYIWRL